MGETGKIKMRVLVAMDADETVPGIVGGVDESYYEVIPDDEWQRLILGWKRAWSMDYASYDYAEVTITVPSHELADLFQHGEIVGSVQPDAS